MTAKSAKSVIQYFGMSLIVPAVLLLGVVVGGIKHADDYQNGWSAGYAAHEHLSTSEDAKLQAAGLCVYARLACGGKK